MRQIVTIGLVSILLFGCNSQSKKSSSSDENNQNKALQNISDTLQIVGNYVDDAYKLRNEGYDWVGIKVKNNAKNGIHISVRSRADKKRPTCTFDADAFPLDSTTYYSLLQGNRILYKFAGDTIFISPENKEDDKLLYFFCSGGATIAGVYHKINEPLDQDQVDKTTFSKLLNWQNIGFNVSTIKKEGVNTLTVYAYGLEIQQFNETFSVEGYRVIDAETGDLNADGSPELVVYLQSDGSGSYGYLMGFSVNNNKSMSQVYFPPVSENKQINEGYMGHDEFAIVEDKLAHRFPIYKKDDPNSNPTGGMRQITYKLVDGEAMRKFEVAKISEY